MIKKLTSVLKEVVVVCVSSRRSKGGSFEVFLKVQAESSSLWGVWLLCELKEGSLRSS